MKCPICRKRLLLINRLQPGEYICSNENCPENINNPSIYAEFYGTTQEEINNNIIRSINN